MTKGAGACSEVKIASSINGVGRTGLVYAKTMKVGCQPTPYTRINSEGIKDLNISHATIKVLAESIACKISDIPHRNIFANISPMAREIKEKMNK